MTDAMRSIPLEQLYVTLGTADNYQGSLSSQVIARSSNVRPEHIAECLRIARLLPPELPTEAMPGAFGLFRGESIEYVIAKSRRNAVGGVPYVQYLFVPSAILRNLSGNIRAFEAFAHEPIPTFNMQRTDLPPYVLRNVGAASGDSQIDDLSLLMSCTKNNLKNISGLLSGLVQGMGIAVLNAPFNLKQRINFVQGLLTLLPAPARVAITYATHVVETTYANTWIKFLARDERPARHLVYDWEAGKILTETPEDPYAKYIMSQLRLDTSLVVEQTEKLAKTAVWRAMRKDDMANALAWISKRASLDSAVENGLPADKGQVAAVLREDPTLPDDLRIAYSRHMIRFALALSEPEGTEVIPAISVQNRDVFDSIYEQLQTAAKTDQAGAVYRLVEHWMTHPPLGVDVGRWRPLLGAAAVTQITGMLGGDAQALSEYLEKFLDAPKELQLDAVMAQIIGLSRRRSADSANIARTLFLLAVLYLPPGGLQRLLGSDAVLASKLPEPMKEALVHLAPTAVFTAPPGTLLHAANAFGDKYRTIVLIRLAEWALVLNRHDLFDKDMLQELVKIASSPESDRFEYFFGHVVADLSHLNILRSLHEEAPIRLLQMSISRGRFAEALMLAEFYQNTFFKGTKKEDLADIMRNTFRELTVTPRVLLTALDTLQRGQQTDQAAAQLRPIAIANAMIGALEGRNFGLELEGVADRLSTMYFNDPRLIVLTGREAASRLLKMNAQRKHIEHTIRVGNALIDYALTLHERGLDVITETFPHMTWHPETKNAALTGLRAYVRRAPMETARAVPQLLGDENIKRALDVTFRLRLIVGGTDLAEFAERVRLGADLLQDMAAVYHGNQEAPPVFRMRRTVEEMTGGLSDGERKRLADNLFKMGEQILRLHHAQQAHLQALIKRGRAEAEARMEQLKRGDVAPTTGVEAMLWFGWHFGEGKTHQLDLDREAPPHLLGSRSVNVLLRETDTLVELLGGLLNAFNDPNPINPIAWRTEIDNLWSLLSLFKQRQVDTILSYDTQKFAQVLLIIGGHGQERSMQPTSIGRQLAQGRAQPRSVIDALRWLNGYFSAQHG
jgi:hypothetical protein